MMRALCLACGSEKNSAWVPCPECEFEPTSLEERARHYWVAERSEDELFWSRVTAVVKAGEELPVDEVELEQLMEDLGEESLLGAALFGLVVGLGPLAALAGALLLFAWLLGRIAT